jgi:hypothetical protein
MQNTKKAPVHEIRIGFIRAAIWEQNTQDSSWHNVTFSRRYKDGNEWKSSDSYSRDDLLMLAKVADQAHTWICEQRANREGNARGENAASRR